jgi:hypothetical protein
MSDLIIPRRRFLQGLFAAPAIIASTSLMPVKVWAEILEPTVKVPAANFGFYIPTWDREKRRFTMQLNDKAPSQMFPEREMTIRDARILAEIDRAFAAQTDKDLAQIAQINSFWIDQLAKSRSD